MPKIGPTETVLARDANADAGTLPAPQPPAVLPGVHDAGRSLARLGTMVPSEGPIGATGRAFGSFPDDGDANGAAPARSGAEFVCPEIPPCLPEPSASFFAKQEWVGRVTAIREDEFDARLRDLTEGGREVATIEMEEVSPDDRGRMYVGAWFHLVMGCERSVRGTRGHVSRLVFLNPTRLTKRDMKRGREWADWLHERWGLK